MMINFYHKLFVFLCINFFVIISAEDVLSQDISLENLFKFHKLNQDQIEDYLLNKGYSRTSNEIYKSLLISHVYDKFENNKIYRSVNVEYYQDKDILGSEYTTEIQREYIILKSQIKQKGFSFTSSQTTERGTYYTYNNKNLPKYRIVTRQYYNPKLGKSYFVIGVVNGSLSDQTYSEIIKNEQENALNNK